ncbi:alkaline phosphatase D family protein, partial [Streptomyces albidoflavus]|uniref:alkaline phosphatase D family protein n=1 Tax=Streptomyces albidoflavus TaxID=1886 RepID=UPI003F4D52DD
MACSAAEPAASARSPAGRDSPSPSLSRPARAATDHTVKADVRGLSPATGYWFRFTAGSTVSPTGRTRTAPAASASPAGLRFGVVSCANWEAGWFSAYRHLAARGDLDAVLHLGDYIYEYATGDYPATPVRPHRP